MSDSQSVDEDHQWSEHLDSSSGKKYYYNETTRRSVWEEEYADGLPVGVAPGLSVEMEEGTCEEHVDSKTGRTYFVDPNTGETRWSQDEEVLVGSTPSTTGSNEEWEEHKGAH